MLQLPFHSRLLTTLSSAMLGMLRDDPREFGIKVKERFRLAKIPVLSSSLNKYITKGNTQSPQRLLMKQGKLSEVLTYRGTDRSELLSRRAKETIEQLKAPILKGKEMSSPVELTADPNAANTPRVLFYLNNSLPHTQSGYTERTHNILTALIDQGATVHAVTRLGYPLLVGKIPHHAVEKIDGVPYERIIPTVYPRSLQARDDEAVRQLVEVARRFKPTVLHTTTDYKNALIVSRAANILGIPWIYEVRGELESTWLSRFPVEEQELASQSDFYTLAHKQETNAMQMASAVISLSEVSKQAMIKRGVAASKIHVVPNAVDESFIGKTYDKHEIRKELGLPDTTIIGSITSVVGYEGLDDLLRATALLPDVTCLIVGDGTARPELENLANELDISDRVIFAGRQPNNTIWKWYAALDVFALPRKDTKVTRIVTPIKALIAQALNISIVASDLPALREITGNCEIYAKPNSVGSLANNIKLTLGTRKGDRKTIPTWLDNATLLIALYLSIQGRC
ncbi:glycosyltransferase family 4 protein [Corynebacterium glucuronolyticum]|uniref:glycosyltransferase family 4 protein n=1 Tax=Corynebacterium glucuronolyticum TaxID=39791 RepID=UPI00223B89A2|nr:glycosyltransferase family 4 protein [Corynebacterium glucuronolyticum]MCT1441649.1 glycosyltransferase family 4 protein [Corynebacterium glucuronolyticum]